MTTVALILALIPGATALIGPTRRVLGGCSRAPRRIHALRRWDPAGRLSTLIVSVIGLVQTRGSHDPEPEGPTPGSRGQRPRRRSVGRRAESSGGRICPKSVSDPWRTWMN